MEGFADRPRRPRSRIHAGKGVSAARKGVNGGATSAALVPEQSRTKDDHDDEDDSGRSKGENFSFALLLFLVC
jgi:hypothetical protein